MRWTNMVIVAALFAALPLALSYAADEQASPPVGASKLSPRDAGARYGEAAGAILLCDSLKITPRVAELRALYQGDELAEFDAQAGKILQAWREASSCEHAEGPDDCRISRQLSCRQALQEIGPSGTALQGLVEPKP